LISRYKDMKISIKEVTLGAECHFFLRRGSIIMKEQQMIAEAGRVPVRRKHPETKSYWTYDRRYKHG